MQIQKLSEVAIVPIRSSQFAAGNTFKYCEVSHLILYLFLGFDISSAYDMVLPKHGKAIVKTDLAIAIPKNTYARIGSIFHFEIICIYFYQDFDVKLPEVVWQ